MDPSVLRRAVRCLPTRQRQAVVMRFFLGMSLREIANAMRWNPQSAARILVRALVALRKRLTREGHVRVVAEPVVADSDLRPKPAPPGGWGAWLRRIGRGEETSGERWWRALYGRQPPE